MNIFIFGGVWGWRGSWAHTVYFLTRHCGNLQEICINTESDRSTMWPLHQ